MAASKKYTGACHCGAVRYDVEADLAYVIACNCSICTKSGALWAYVAPDAFRHQSGEAGLVDYRFASRRIHHLFCGVCGIESFARGADAAGNEGVAINVRCLDAIDVAALETMPFDGQSL